MTGKLDILETSEDYWYLAPEGRFYENSRLANPIVLEFSQKHLCKIEEGAISIVIEQDSELYQKLKLLIDHPILKPKFD